MSDRIKINGADYERNGYSGGKGQHLECRNDFCSTDNKQLKYTIGEKYEVLESWYEVGALFPATYYEIADDEGEVYYVKGNCFQ